MKKHLKPYPEEHLRDFADAKSSYSSIDAMIRDLQKSVGSKLDPMRAFVISTGDGNSYVMFEDSRSGEIQGAEFTPTGYLDIEDEVYDHIMSTYE